MSETPAGTGIGPDEPVGSSRSNHRNRNMLILGGLALVLVAGAVFVGVMPTGDRARTTATDASPSPTATTPAPTPLPVQVSGQQPVLLAVLVLLVISVLVVGSCWQCFLCGGSR